MSAGQQGGVIIPAFRYEDAARMIEWLCEAFGFERRLVVPGEQGAIAHAELTIGNGMIMLGSTAPTEFGRQPARAHSERPAPRS